MFKWKPRKPDEFQPQIDNLLGELKNHEPHTEQYAATMAQLKSIYEIRASAKKQRSVSPDVVATIAANLAGILIILTFEKANVITSKAFSQVFKPKT